MALGILVTVSGAQSDTRAADEAAIRMADAEWSKAVAAKDVDRIASLYTGDATLVPRDQEMVKGRTEIREGWSRIFAIAGFTQSSRMTALEVVRAGFIAQSYSTYEAVMLDDQKRRVTQRGRRTVYWTRYLDGSWKILLEIYSEDWPPP